jgi:cytoskeletal protein CcmA (bactofilin family)
MGRSSKESGNTESYQEQSPSNLYQYSGDVQPQPARAVSESESMARDIKEGRLSGYVGNGTVLTGETNFQAMLRVDGHLTGRVTSENGTLIIGSTGRVDANIAVAAAVVNGTVNGDIIASEKLELGRSARVVGNVQTPRVVIEDGAIFEGNCSMLKAKESADKRNAAVKSGYAPVESPAAETPSNDDSDPSDEVAEAVAG